MMNDTHEPTGDEGTARDRVSRERRNDSHDPHARDRGFDRDQAEQEARAAIGNARDELQSLLERQKNAAADQVRAVADALRHTEDGLRDKGQNSVAAYVAHVADRIDYWAGRLRESHIEELSRDIQNLASRQPGLFIAGAAVAGFAAVRFLKSTQAAGTRRTSGSLSATGAGPERPARSEEGASSEPDPAAGSGPRNTPSSDIPRS